MKVPSTAWVHTLDALPDTTYVGPMDIPTGNPTSLLKGSTSNDTVDKALSPKLTTSDGATHTKAGHPLTSDMSMVQGTNPLAKVTPNKSDNTPRDPKKGDEITQSINTSDTGDTPGKGISCDKCSHTFFTLGALKVHTALQGNVIKYIYTIYEISIQLIIGNICCGLKYNHLFILVYCSSMI